MKVKNATATTTVSNNLKIDEKATKKKDKSRSPLRKVPNEEILIPPIDRDTMLFNH